MYIFDNISSEAANWAQVDGDAFYLCCSGRFWLIGKTAFRADVTYALHWIMTANVKQFEQPNNIDMLNSRAMRGWLAALW